MSFSFGDFLIAIIHNPILLVITILISGVIFVNGCSDAPNSIATSVATRCISPGKALIMVAICNILGIFVITFIGATVAKTIYNIADFGNNAHLALLALCSAMVAIVLWTFVTWIFGIPTSQSHTIVATLSGSAIALQKGITGVNFNEWKKVIFGIVISTFLGFIFGFLITKIIQKIFKNTDRRRVKPFFKYGVIIGDAIEAFLNSAQDVQKFVAIFMMGVLLSNNVTSISNLEIPIWMLIMCASILTLGTCVCGSRIIKNVGMKMAKLETYQATSADIAGAICLISSTLTGIPISTTQTKTTAIMGVGAAKRFSSVDWNIAKNMVLAWIITFPGSGILAYIVTNLFLKIF